VVGRVPGDAGLDALGRFVSRRELDLLRRRLRDDERILGGVDAVRGRRKGLLAATDRRIAWVAKGVLRRTVKSWPYEDVGKVEVRVERAGATIDLLLDGRSETFAQADREQARAFAAAVKAASPRRAFRKVTAVTDPAYTTPLSELLEEPFRSRLARLERMHDRGTVTEPEYQASRQGILEEAGLR
jgi:Bacterial PH domain